MRDLILLLHTGSTLSMCGLIWFVQMVHYPLFASVGRNDFALYEKEHIRRTGWVVGPLMIAEGITAFWLLAFPPSGCGRVIPLIGIVLLLLIWGSTAILQVPTHRQLERGFLPDHHRRLTRTNWIRTILWSIRALLALWMVRLGPVTVPPVGGTASDPPCPPFGRKDLAFIPGRSAMVLFAASESGEERLGALDSLIRQGAGSVAAGRLEWGESRPGAFGNREGGSNEPSREPTSR